MFFCEIFEFSDKSFLIPMWFTLYNAISIVEHCHALGVPLPKFILDFLKKGLTEFGGDDSEIS